MLENLDEAASWIERELPASQAEELAYLLSTEDVSVDIEETVSIIIENERES